MDGHWTYGQDLIKLAKDQSNSWDHYVAKMGEEVGIAYCTSRIVFRARPRNLCGSLPYLSVCKEGRDTLEAQPLHHSNCEVYRIVKQDLTFPSAIDMSSCTHSTLQTENISVFKLP